MAQHTLKWNKSRLRELERLHRLLVEITTINHGSSAAQRIIHCEREARRLLQTNIGTGRASFHQFLVECARVSYFGRRK